MPSKSKITRPVSRSLVAFLSTLALAAGALAPHSASAAVDPEVAATSTRARDTPNIEDIVKIGIEVGSKIGQPGGITLSTENAAALAVNLGTALADRRVDGAGLSNPLNPDNIADEVGEVAAFVMNAVAGSEQFRAQSNRNLARLVAFAIVKRALMIPKNKASLVSAAVVTDAVASFALTIHNDSRITAGFENYLKRYLKSKVKKIAGKTYESSARRGLNLGFAGSASTNLVYEDGNIPSLAQINDPETDQRNA